MKKLRLLLSLSTLLLAVTAGFFLNDFMQRPPSFDLREIEFPRALRERDDMPVIEVLFASNRRPLETGNNPQFADEPDGQLHYGRAEVRIPANYTIGDVQRPEMSRGSTDEERATVEKVEIMTEPEFRALVAKRMAGQEHDGATLFVHGMNHSFDSAVRQAGALQFALNLRQPMILFSWPTQPAISVSGYRRSQEQITGAAESLEKFLEPYRQSRFDLLAHSLGCKVVCRTFDHLMNNDLWKTAEDKLPNVILAAPDVDPEDFSHAFLGKLDALADRTTVYIARNDHALVMSDFLNSRPRLGAAITPEIAVRELVNMSAGDNSRVEIIDATFVNNERTSHGYFYQSRPVFSDLHNLLRNDLPASERQLLRHEKATEANYWIIPP
jgi:esterase/lipase superfamily enzyme